MDRNAKERLLALISWGKVVTDAPSMDSGKRRVILRPPTPHELGMATLVWEESFSQAVAMGLLTNDQAVQCFIDLGQWSESDERRGSGLRDDLMKLRRGLLDYLYQDTRLEQVRKAIRTGERALLDHLNRRSAMLVSTAETHATTCQQRWLVGRVATDEQGDSLWPKTVDFEQDTDSGLARSLVDFYFGHSRLSEAVIRELARTDPWRYTWSAVKLTGQVFGGGPETWSPNQAELVKWSQIYDFVFESLERPSERVVEDDDLMDSWMIRQGDRFADGARRKEAEALGRSGRASGRDEIFVQADREGAKRVYELNDPRARKTIQSQQRLVTERGVVKEVDLPQSRLEIREQAMEARRDAIKGTKP